MASIKRNPSAAMNQTMWYLPSTCFDY